MSNQDPWERRADRFGDRPVRTAASGVVRVWVIVVLITLLAGGLSIAHWGFGVFTSDIKGRGDVEVTKNSGANRIEQQEKFESYYQEIQATDQNIQVTADGLRANPNDTKLQTELRGQKQYCNTIVGQYNALARKVRSEDFRAVDLPSKIDQSDSTTDCKEN